MIEIDDSGELNHILETIADEMGDEEQEVTPEQVATMFLRQKAGQEYQNLVAQGQI